MLDNNEVNPYEAILDQFGDEKDKRLKTSMFQAVKKKPDAHAQILDLSRKSNLPVDLVERNTQVVQERVSFNKNKYDDILKNYKSVGEFLSDPNKAALTYDDVDGIVHVADYFRSFGAGGLSIGGALSGFPEIADAIQNKLPDFMSDSQADIYRKNREKRQDFKNKQHPLIKMFYPENQLKFFGEQFKSLAENVRPPEDRQSYGTDISEGLGQLGAQAILTVVTGGATSVATFTGMGADEMATRADQQGANQEDKDNAVLMGSLITAATEKMGVDLLLDRLPPKIKNKALGKLVDIAIGGGIEATQEAVEAYLQNVVEKITFNPDKDLSEGIADQAKVAGPTGAIARGFLTAIGARRINQDNVAAYNTEKHVQEINELLDRVAATKLNERSPEDAQTLFQSILNEQGIEEFNIDANSFIEQVEEMGGDPTEIAIELGIENDFERAVIYDGVFKVPAEKFLSVFADSEYREAAVNSFRPNPNSMTALEAETHISNIEKQTEEIIKQSEIDADEVLVMQTKADEVYDAVVQAIGEGGVEQRTGQKRPIAELFRANAMRQMADWAAEGKEFDPKTFYDGLGLTFTNENDVKQDEKKLRNVKDINLSAMLNELRGRKKQGNEISPLFDYIKKSGKIKTGSQLAKELAAIGINPKTNIGLFSKKGTFGDADNIVASEFQEMFGVTPQVDDNGYVDRNWLLEKISGGVLGSKQDFNEIDDLARIMDEMGLDINDDNDVLIKKLTGEGELNQSNDRILYQSLRDPVAVEFSKKVDDLLNGKKITEISVLSKETPLLEKLGLPSRKMVITPSVLRKVLNEKHGDEVDPEVIKRLPELIADPLAIVVSGKNLVHVLDAKDKEGKQVIAAIKLSGMIERNKAHIVLSAYGKNEFINWYHKQKESLVYIDDMKNRPIRELASTPIAESDNQATKYKIRKKSEIVKELNHDINRGGIRGDFGNLKSQFEIFTTKDADMSTILHETGHLFLEMMNREASMEDAPDRVKNNLNDTLKYLGVKSFNEVGTEQHELFARTFEVYLREGKAPNFKLRRVFEKFKAWLVETYQRLTGKYNIEISPDVKKIFDTILATEEEILVAEQDSDIKISPVIAELMSGNAKTKYLEAAEDAHAQAYNDALVAKIRAEKKRLSKQWAEDKKRVEKNVSDQVWSEDLYQVWHLVSKGEFYNQKTPESFKGKRLDKSSLIDVAGSKGVLKDLPKMVPPIYQDNGLDVDILASSTGFNSGSHLIKELINAERPLDKIKRLTNEIMESEYPMPDPADQAMKAVHNERQAIFIDAELKAIRKKTNEDTNQNTLQIVRDEVDRLISITPMKDIMKPLQYLANSRRAGRAAEKAIIENDFDRALQNKRTQLFNHEMFRKTLDAKTKADKIQKRLNKLANKKIDPKRIAPDYIKTIKELLGAYSYGDINTPRKAKDIINELRLKAQEQNLNADDEGRPEVLISQKLINASELTHWRDLTFEELTALNDTTKSLEKLGRQETAAEKEARLQVLNEMALSIEDNVKARKGAGSVKDQADIDLNKTKLSSSFLRKLPSLISEFDGGNNNGIMSKYILEPLEDAAAKYEEIITPIREAMEGLQKKHYKFNDLRVMGKRNIYVEQINETLTKEEILSLAMNWGNTGNREAVLNGGIFKGLAEQDVMNILNDNMDKRDWDFVQGSLDIVNSLWGEISALEERQSGVVPEKVEAAPIHTKYGEYSGGYYPLSYSPVSSKVSNFQAREAQTDKPVLGSARASTKHGFTNERVSGHGLPVKLNLSVMYDHLGSVVHDLAYREAIQTANKYLRNPIVGDAIIKTKGLKTYENIQLIIKSSAIGDAGIMQGWDRWFKQARLNFSVAVIGLNMRSILTQPTGLMQAFVSNKVGMKYMASSLMDFGKDAYKINQRINEIQAKSAYMKKRAKVFRRELREQSHRIGTTGIKDKMVEASFYPMIKMDAMTASIVWSGAYNKGIDLGYGENEAIRYADRMVRDTQASGEQYQLSGLANSGEFGKALTIFGSYFSATYNLTAESFRQAQVKGDPKAWGNFVMDMILLHGVQGMLAALLLEHWPEDDEGWFKWSLTALGSQVTGMIPVMSSVYRSMLSGYGVSLLPAEAAINTTIRTVGGLAKDVSEGENPLNEKNAKNMARTASYWFGVPGINGIIRGYEVLDENPDATPIDVLLRPKEK